MGCRVPDWRTCSDCPSYGFVGLAGVAYALAGHWDLGCCRFGFSCSVQEGMAAAQADRLE